jgi:hypothetical protein
MTLIRRLLYAVVPPSDDALLERAANLIRLQANVIENLEAELNRTHLEYLREIQGIVSGWLIHTDQPELDIRGDLAEFDSLLGHRIAMHEEHVV